MKYTYQQAKHRHKKWREKLRQRVIEVLGGKCKECGFDDWRALQVDHVNGGGSQEKKSITRTFYILVLESVLRKENKYQLLCANCNWIKKYKKGETK